MNIWSILYKLKLIKTKPCKKCGFLPTKYYPPIAALPDYSCYECSRREYEEIKKEYTKEEKKKNLRAIERWNEENK